MAIITTTTRPKSTSMDDEASAPKVEADRGGLLSRDMYPSDVGEDAEATGSALPLLVWLSPSFPVGSFAFSHGLEWAVQSGDIKDAASAIEWIGGLIEHGALRNDAIFAACAWRAATKGESRALAEVAELALAMAGSRERYLETAAQGNAFATVIREAWASPSFTSSFGQVAGGIAYPVAIGMAAAGYRIPLDVTLRSYVVATIQNLVSATIRLSAIGHTDGQRIIAALMQRAVDLGREAETATLDDVGGAAFQSDLAALKHGRQYTRLFRS